MPIPAFLYGTAWKEDETERLTGLAIGAGFRGIDTANQRRHYFEAGVGQGLAAAYRAGLVTRADLFLQTKFTYRDGQDHRLPYDPEAGLKVSRHHSGEVVDPDRVDRTEHVADVERVRAFMHQNMPGADGPVREAFVCLYTNTPDFGFVIDVHPAVPGVAFASACSGHGFKFAPVVGEILADLALDGSTLLPIAPFRARRFVE